MPGKQHRAASREDAAGSSESGPRTFDVREVFGNEYMQRLLQAGLTEAEVDQSTRRVTANARRYLTNDEETVARVGEDGHIRASHTGTNEANEKAVEEKSAEIEELTECIQELRERVRQNPQDDEAKDALSQAKELRRELRKARHEDRRQADFHGFMAWINRVAGREDE